MKLVPSEVLTDSPSLILGYLSTLWSLSRTTRCRPATISAATRNHKDALGWYNEATRYGVAEGAEISEMRARAYFQRAKLQADGIGRTAHAKSDFEQAASIWGALGETKAASEAEWELAILNNELSREVVQLLGKEVPRVRIIALEQFRKERAAHSARGIAKRQQAGSEYWEWKVKEARRLFALEESDW